VTKSWLKNKRGKIERQKKSEDDNFFFHFDVFLLLFVFMLLIFVKRVGSSNQINRKKMHENTRLPHSENKGGLVYEGISKLEKKSPKRSSYSFSS
jgi:hypothetical protein